MPVYLLSIDDNIRFRDITETIFDLCKHCFPFFGINSYVANHQHCPTRMLWKMFLFFLVRFGESNIHLIIISFAGMKYMSLPIVFGYNTHLALPWLKPTKDLFDTKSKLSNFLSFRQ